MAQAAVAPKARLGGVSASPGGLALPRGQGSDAQQLRPSPGSRPSPFSHPLGVFGQEERTAKACSRLMSAKQWVSSGGPSAQTFYVDKPCPSED